MSTRSYQIEDVKQYLKDNKCKLLSTFFKDYPNQKQKRKRLWIRYIAKCGHETSTCFSVFKKISKNRNPIGRNCKDCSYKIANTNNNSREENKEIYGNPQEQEVIGQNIFLKYINPDEFDIYNTNEGAHADLLIKPKNEEEWLNIQIKTTIIKRTFDNCYLFSNTSNYPNFLMILVFIPEEKIWLMNGNKCLKLKHLCFSEKGKYSKYLVNNGDINDMVKECYFDENYKKTTKEEGCKSLCQNYNIERKYFNMRSERLPFLDIEDFKIDNDCTDAIINGHKVQDKLTQQDKKNENRVCVSIRKSNGIKNGKRITRIPYEQGDNDYYWFHMPERFGNLFYCIPERCLIENGYLKTENCKGKTTLLLYPKGHDNNVLSTPCQKYLFNYEEVNENTKIFK